MCGNCLSAHERTFITFKVPTVGVRGLVGMVQVGVRRFDGMVRVGVKFGVSELGWFGSIPALWLVMSYAYKSFCKDESRRLWMSVHSPACLCLCECVCNSSC